MAKRNDLFFDVAMIHDIAANPKNRRKARFCAHCQCEREHISAHYHLCGASGTWHKFPREYVCTRVCGHCGYTRGVNPGVTDRKLKTRVWAADNHECVYCGSTENLTADHVLPYTYGGEATFENLVTACNQCNVRRKAEEAPAFRFGRYRTR